jgi:hypothetical protein
MVLTRDQRIFVVKHYFRKESYALCQEAFQEAFPNDTLPNRKTICRIITKFEETGSVCDRKHNRRRTVLNDDTLEDVRLSLLQPPSKSLQQLSQQKNVSLGSAHQAVHLLHLRAYRIHVMHELISKGFGPPGLQTYLHQISFCGVISKDMSTTVILTHRGPENEHLRD